MTRHPRRHSTRLIAGSLLVSAGLAGAAYSSSSAGAAPKPRISLTPIGTYETRQFDESAAEIVAYDPASEQVFVVNALEGAIDVLDISDPSAPVRVTTLFATGAVNSVAVRDGFVAVAVESDPPQLPGSVEFYSIADIDPDVPAIAVSAVTVGSLPDMLTFTPDGTKVVVANEGEPDEYCADDNGDPEGSISIIDVSGGVEDVEQSDVETADFHAFNGQEQALRDEGVRIFGPGASVAQDLEPEYVGIDADSTTAWVSLQENNAFAIVDLASAMVTDIVPLGYKDHSLPGNALDPSDRDGELDEDGDATGAINIGNWPVKGMYMPDAIDTYEFGRRTYVVTANEGDARDYDCFSEEARIGDLTLDPTTFPEAETLQEEQNLGRLDSTTSFPTDLGGDGVTELFSYGARSFSIWDEAGSLVFDSGDDFEQITAAVLPDDFNSSNDDNDDFDSRSDAKGPEPEGIEIGTAYSKTYAFIGLERVGGIMVYDITTPRNPQFVQYINRRDFGFDAEISEAGDLGPEGLTFIAAADSPNGMPLLVVGNEVSGTTTIFQIDGPGRSR